MKIDQEILQVLRDVFSIPYIVEDTVNSMTYMCYPAEQGTAFTDPKWRVIRIDESSSGIAKFECYKSDRYDNPIDTGAGVLATLRSYTGWVLHKTS